MRWAVRTLGLVLAFTWPVLIAVVVLLWPTDPGRQTCSSVAFLIQESARCAANPMAWGRWSELKKWHGLAEGEGMADAKVCPMHIERALAMGVSYEALEETGRWLGPETSVRGLWNDVIGQEFCQYAEQAGWIERYEQLLKKTRQGEKDGVEPR